MFDQHTVVADVYVACKLSKTGHRFAFIKFFKTKPFKHVVADMNTVWGIWSVCFFASRARFGQKEGCNVRQEERKQQNYKPDLQDQEKKKKPQLIHNKDYLKSYLTVVNGKYSTIQNVLVAKLLKSLSLV